MSNPEQKRALSLENCWSIPETKIMYLEKGQISAELKNNSDRLIEVLKVTCHFETEEGLEPYAPSVEPKISIKPRNLSQRIEIPFETGLSLIGMTNSYKLSVTYRQQGSLEPMKTTYSCSVIPSSMNLLIYPARPAVKHFFISHKDPVNTKLSERLHHYLQKAGFNGYIAENDRQPGVDFWNGKVIPNIESCIALIVLWTYEAMKEPDVILREVKHANNKGKTIIVLAENDLQIPDSFPKEREQIRLSRTITETDLIKLVKDIEYTYRTGGYNGIEK